MAHSPSAILLDTSAVVAILTRESAAPLLLAKLLASPLRLLPTPCAAEAFIVLHGKMLQNPEPFLTGFLQEFDVQLVAFDPHHLVWFHHAFTRYGKGRHPAALNLGDCFTYAIAKATGLPLLFVGEDFSKTDLTQA